MAPLKVRNAELALSSHFLGRGGWVVVLASSGDW